MIHGLLWLPLLFAFFWLAWSGWNEYQKIEAYRLWAGQFERAKYDIYAVLAQKDSDLTWGKPTRQGPIELQTFSLKDVQSINLLVDEKAVTLEQLPIKVVLSQLSLFCHKLIPLLKCHLPKFPLLPSGASSYKKNSIA